MSDRRNMSEVPDLVLSSYEDEDDSDDDDPDQTIVQLFTPRRLSSSVIVSPTTPSGPPSARVTGPPFTPRPFILSPSSSPISAFSVQGESQEVDPVLQQGGSGQQQQAGGAHDYEEEENDEDVDEDVHQDGAGPQVAAPALPNEDVPVGRPGGPSRSGSGRMGVRRSVRLVPLQTQAAAHPAAVREPPLQGGAGPVEEVAPVLQDVVPPAVAPLAGAHLRGVDQTLGQDRGVDEAQPALGEREDLGPWLDPHVPGPLLGPLLLDGDGWNQIDHLGMWECGLSTFRHLEEVPLRYREKWAKVMSTILRRLQQATSEEEEARALKWFLIAPQAFLREPKRGGKKGQIFSALNTRFDCVVRGDFGSILQLLESDKLAARHNRGRVRRGADDDTTARAKLRKTILSLLKRGQIGRAVRRICSHGIASMDDAEVQAALQAKYPGRGRGLPASVNLLPWHCQYG